MHRRSSRRMVAVLSLTIGGCAPLTPSVPIHLVETTEILPQGRFALGATFGGGGLSQEGRGTGGSLRARVGTGAKQEVGLEGGVIYGDSGQQRGKGPVWAGQSTAFGARLSWKGAPLPWFAVLAGVGASSSATGAAMGADLGVLFSSGRALLGRLRPYAAARAFVAAPVGRERDSVGGITSTLAVPVGLAITAGRSVRLFLEGGALVGWSSIGATAAPPLVPGGPPAGDVYDQTLHGGGYGVFGVMFVLERNPDSIWFIDAMNRWR